MFTEISNSAVKSEGKYFKKCTFVHKNSEIYLVIGIQLSSIFIASLLDKYFFCNSSDKFHVAKSY